MSPLIFLIRAHFPWFRPCWVLKLNQYVSPLCLPSPTVFVILYVQYNMYLYSVIIFFSPGVPRVAWDLNICMPWLLIVKHGANKFGSARIPCIHGIEMHHQTRICWRTSAILITWKRDKKHTTNSQFPIGMILRSVCTSIFVYAAASESINIPVINIRFLNYWVWLGRITPPQPGTKPVERLPPLSLVAARNTNANASP